MRCVMCSSSVITKLISNKVKSLFMILSICIGFQLSYPSFGHDVDYVVPCVVIKIDINMLE